MSETIELVPIGFVSSPVTERTDSGWGDVVARIVLEPQYAGALAGLESFSHALAITYLHQARFVPAEHLRRRPRGREDMPELGILAQRAKNRPNPIGVTAVEIVGVSERHLDVRGLDAIDGTPVLDVKPYVPQYDRVAAPRVPGWVDELMKGYF